MWKWPVVKYKHIKIHVKPRICVLYMLFLTWTVNANLSKQNIIVIKEIVFCCHFGWMNKRWFCLQKTGSQEHIYLISIMFRLKKNLHSPFKCVPKKKKKHNEEIMAFWHRSKLSVTWLFATFLYLYVHSVEDSTLMPIFDQFRFSFVFSGVAKNRP